MQLARAKAKAREKERKVHHYLQVKAKARVTTKANATINNTVNTTSNNILNTTKAINTTKEERKVEKAKAKLTSGAINATHILMTLKTAGTREEKVFVDYKQIKSNNHNNPINNSNNNKQLPAVEDQLRTLVEQYLELSLVSSGTTMLVATTTSVLLFVPLEDSVNYYRQSSRKKRETND